MRRCPSFSARPGFPRGLQVLVLDPEVAAGVEAEVQLKECGYRPITCTSSAEALVHLTNPDGAFDLLLVDVACLSAKSPENTALLAAAKTLPLVLMSACCSPGDIMVGIRQGAVDFLEKPLHLHRLKNIWQHVVRKMMGGSSSFSGPLASVSAPLSAAAAGSPPQAAAAGDGPSAAAGSTPASEDSAGAGETGSNESTSERANVKHAQDAMELDLETSSLLDAVDAALGNPLAGLTSGFSHLLMSEGAPSAGPDTGLVGSAGSSAQAHMRRQPGAGRFSADLPRQGSAPLHGGCSRAERKPRTSVPGNTCSSSACDSKPVLGYPAGQLPAVGAGIEWGLPTNPLQIAPKPNPMAPKPPSLPWMPPLLPGGMLMPPMVMPGLPGLPGAVPPFLLPPSMPGAATAPSPPPQPPCGPPASPGMLPPPLTLPTAAAAAATTSASIAKTPVPASCVSPAKSASAASLLGPASPPTGCDLLSTLSCSKSGQAPIGLQLKKSMSLVDLINNSLMRGSAGVQV